MIEVEGRTTVQLGDKWGFKLDPERTGDKQQWQASGLPSPEYVQVPHTWNIDSRYDEYRGLAWYEYSFLASEDWKGMMARLRFEAVYRDASVWLNGVLVGSHSGSGFTPFILDATDAIRMGEQNRLVVSVDNSSAEQALPMLRSFDWADDGGLIRHVSLIVTGQTTIDFLKIDAVPLFDGNAEAPIQGLVNVRAALYGEEADKPESFEYQVNMKYADRTVWSGTAAASRLGDYAQLDGIPISNAQLWHFDHPHLYELEVKLVRDGCLLDRYRSTFGFREIVTVGSELWLNREPVRLFGVEWMPGSNPDIGMAEKEEDLIKFLEQIKHANCVITRFHWQQDEKLLDWCDRNGLLVQEEIPHWQQPALPGQETLELAQRQAYEMINRHYNHPCLYAWGMGNEIDGQAPGTTAYMRELRAYMQTLDDRRMLNYVSNTVQIEPNIDATGVGDVIMWNEYIGTWHEDLDFEEAVGRIKGAYPHKPICIAEYGLCEPAFEGGDVRRAQILRDKTELYRAHPSIAYLIYFSLNDYRTQMGEEGTGRYMQRVHGSVDMYGNPKPSYQVLRELAAPVQVLSVLREADRIDIKLQARNDIPSHRIIGYQLKVERAAGLPVLVNLPDLNPGEVASLSIQCDRSPSQSETLEILRPNGFSVLALCLKSQA